MSQFDQALRLFEELDGLEDAFIEEGMLPDEDIVPARSRLARGRNLLAWLAGNRWGVAILSGILVVGLLTATIGLGNGNKNMEADDAPPLYEPNYGSADNRYDGDMMPDEVVGCDTDTAETET